MGGQISIEKHYRSLFRPSIMAKSLEPWILIFRSSGCQKLISCKILVFGVVCKKLLKTASNQFLLDASEQQNFARNG